MGINHDDDHPSCAGRSHIMSGEWVKGRNPSDLSWSTCSRDDLESFLSNVQEDWWDNIQHLMCAGLWCLVEGDTSCKTKLDPPLDGTECGADKWCRAGECVSKTPIPQHVDGDWSSWSQWSVCSRTCGTGARFRQRKCDNPPPGPGGKHCQKASVEHKACEGPPCSKGFPTFRDQQCQSHDRQASKKQNHWTAVINDEKPCALFCNPLGRDSPELVAERVLDGTPCGPYETDLCVNGKCQKIGCDGVIGSSAKEDRCSVCNGDGKSCKIVKGDFSHARGTGYIEAAVIPAGARRIKVVEDKPAHSFLALKDSSKRSINSDWKIELPGEFQIAGTTVRYVRRGLWEKMSAKGPTETPLQLLSLSNLLEPLIKCERKTTVSCMQMINKTMTLANESSCPIENRPAAHIRRCNIHPCQSRWVTVEWGPCSITCAKGIQLREVTCVYQLQNGSYVNTRDIYCLGPKPTTVQGCEGLDCLTVWEASEWSKCSADCGKGTHRRTVTCTNSQGKCDPATRPREEEACEDHSNCYEWKTGDWSKVKLHLQSLQVEH
ncbi:UNVERIFIED_CONTAM: hypothetical protein FKN15_036558 [Acipenser sinensis]